VTVNDAGYVIDDILGRSFRNMEEA